MNSEDQAQRYAAVLLGGHLGDSLGGPIETWTPPEIAQHYGKVNGLIAATLYRDAHGTIVPGDRAGGNWHAQQRPGEPSDDTILTIAVARAVAHHGYDIDAVAREHVDAIAIRQLPDGSISGGFGKTTLHAIKRLVAGIPPQESGVNGMGNAPPMKMAPVGLYAHATHSYTTGMSFAALVGRMTHTDDRSIAAGVTQAHAIYALLMGSDRKESLQNMIRVAYATESSTTTTSDTSITHRLRWVERHQDASVDEALAVIGNDGRAFSSYPFTVFMHQRHWDTPLEGLIETINLGGDADTNGAMYGALAAAHHGRFWPAEWEERLEERAACITLGHRIAQAGRDKGAI